MTKTSLHSLIKRGDKMPFLDFVFGKIVVFLAFLGLNVVFLILHIIHLFTLTFLILENLLLRALFFCKRIFLRG